MNRSFLWLGASAVVAIAACAPLHHSAEATPLAAASRCAADSNYQRLAFWVGDWDLFDSTGLQYATQRVRPVVDACAFTAEWTGRVGDRGLGLAAFDVKTGEWKQFYVSNLVAIPSGVWVRKSDPSYTGPGIRLIPLVEPASGDLSRSRMTIMPMPYQRALQLFEDSPDGGKTWRTVFKSDNRPRVTSAPQ